MSIRNWLKKNASTLLTCFGAGGMAATVILAVKATPGAMKKIDSARTDRAEEIIYGRKEGTIETDEQGAYILPPMSALETAQACWTEYVLPAAVGLGSLALIFGANALSRKQQASMAAAYTALASAFEGYRGKVKMLCGPNTDAMIEKAVAQEQRDREENRPPWDEVQTFYLEYCEKPAFFERTMEQVLKAEYELNRYFILNGQATLNEFLDILGLEAVEGGDQVGWESWIGETQYGYRWIDFNHRFHSTDDGLLVCSIDLPFGPHPLLEGA